MSRLLAVIGMLAALALGTGPATSEEPTPSKRRHAILVLLGGGIHPDRAEDETRMPRLAALAEKGVVLRPVATERRPFAAARSILTGKTADADEPVLGRPAHPTVMEYARRGLSPAGQAVWFVSFEGDEALRLAYSEHPDYGVAAAPRIAHGDGAFAEPLRPVLATLGRPIPTEDDAWTQLRRLRRVSRQAVGAWIPEGVDAATVESERVERAILAEVDRRALLVRGPAPRDVRAVRAASTVLRVHRPRLTVIRLGDLALATEEAQRDALLTEEDRLLGVLWQTVLGDPLLAARTALFVVGETPPVPSEEDVRRRRPARVLFVARGAGLRRARGRVDARVEDVAPTILRFLGVGLTGLDGRALDEVLAE